MSAPNDTVPKLEPVTDEDLSAAFVAMRDAAPHPALVQVPDYAWLRAALEADRARVAERQRAHADRCPHLDIPGGRCPAGRPIPPSAADISGAVLAHKYEIQAGKSQRQGWERALGADRWAYGVERPVSIADLDRAEQSARGVEDRRARAAAVLTADREAVR